MNLKCKVTELFVNINMVERENYTQTNLFKGKSVELKMELN